MCPERVRNRVLNGRSGRLFAGFMLPGQARLSQRDVSSERNGKKHFICSQPKTGGAARQLATGLTSQCRALSTAGPSSGIAEIHLPIRDRPCSSGLATSPLAGGVESGIDSGGTG